MKNPGFLQRLRTWTGLASVWILHLGAFGWMQRNVCTPGFACHGCRWATFACPIGVMAHGSVVRAIPALAIATILAVGMAVGRLLCGFACPFGWLQDCLHKIPSPKIRLHKSLRYIKYAALVLLVFVFPYLSGQVIEGYLAMNGKPKPNKTEFGDVTLTVFLENRGTTPVQGVDLTAVYYSNEDGSEIYRSPEPFHFDVTVAPGKSQVLDVTPIPNKLAEASIGIECKQSVFRAELRNDLYYCKTCPVGTLTAHLPRYLEPEKAEGGVYGLASSNALRLAVLGFFLILMVLATRPFCRTFCPLGALYGLCSRFAFLRICVDQESCVKCGLCDKVCPVELDVRKEAGGPECIACGDCIKSCNKKSISRKAGI